MGGHLRSHLQENSFCYPISKTCQVYSKAVTYLDDSPMENEVYVINRFSFYLGIGKVP